MFLDPILRPPIGLAVSSAAACWALAVITREYSWVDRLWSVLPIGYSWLFAGLGGWHPRSILMAALITTWGLRLTYNFGRKGGYARGGEDYRWGELRKRMSARAFQAFNLTFIAGYQNLLLFLISLPAWAVAERPANPLGAWDAALAVAFLLALTGETVADQQQWEFQQRKRAALARGEPVDPPFVNAGLFRFARHPNFLCEQAQWWIYTLFPVTAGGIWLSWASLGAVLLTLLFDGSARFTESISARKYPAYLDYQRRVSRMLPWL